VDDTVLLENVESLTTVTVFEEQYMTSRTVDQQPGEKAVEPGYASVSDTPAAASGPKHSPENTSSSDASEVADDDCCAADEPWCAIHPPYTHLSGKNTVPDTDSGWCCIVATICRTMCS
jgi:hypothetical protein